LATAANIDIANEARLQDRSFAFENRVNIVRKPIMVKSAPLARRV